MKNLSILLTAALIMISCAKDPCKDVVCLNDGTCLDGTCLCADWYEGVDCGTEERAKYYGTYNGTLTLSQGGQPLQSAPFVMTISGGTSINKLQFIGTGTNALDSEASLTVTKNSDFTLPSFTNSALGGPATWSGAGTFSGSEVSMTGQVDFTGVGILDWTYTATK
jgi:hypothetical protein